jgi:hypothetical protein
VALKPAETRMISGSNSRQIGTTIERKAARYSASPKLDTGGRGRGRERERGREGERERERERERGREDVNCIYMHMYRGFTKHTHACTK